MNSELKKELQIFATQIRMGIIEGTYNAKAGHPGGSLSAAEVFAYLYGKEMRYNPKDPKWEDRDRFVLSKGHCAPGLYSALAYKGFFPVEDIKTLRKIGSYLQGHPNMNTVPGVDMSTGSLGQGTSEAVGLALGDKLQGRDCTTYLMVGDGEANEGQVWEAAMFTSAKKLTNLVWLIDWNKKQLDGFVSDILEPFDFEEKFKAFGFDACTIDGNDVAQLKEALSKKATDKPIAIILDTVKGKGVTEVEEAAGNHSMNVAPEVFDRWIDEIRGQDSNFEEEQAETWNQYFNKFNVDEGSKYPALKDCCEEFGYINDFLERADAVGGIKEKFNGIQNAYVDQNALRKAVDEHLVKLVSADDAKERKLREQERYLLAVKACQGDIEAARNLVNKQRKEEKTRTMNIVEQLTHIISDDQSVMPSQKKTAVSFLHGYINKGYTKYIAEKRKAFPEKITIRLNGWSGETTDGANEDALIASYNQYLSAEANQKKTALLNSDNSKTMNIVAIVLALAAVMGAFLNPILLILLAVAGYVFFSGKKKVSNIQKGIEETDKQYQDMAVNGRETIHQCCDQWKRVTEYLQSFESQKPETIVA